MSDFISQFEVLVLKAKKRAGPFGCLAFGFGVIRQLLKEPGVSPEERCEHISQIVDLIHKHTKL